MVLNERHGARSAIAAACLVLAAVLLAAGGTGPPRTAAASAQDSDPPHPRATEATVVLRDGRRITGVLVEYTDDRVVVEIAGIRTEFAMDRVDQVQVLPPLLERYRARRSAIDDEDVEGLMALVRWLQEEREYGLALRETLHILTVDPYDAQAKRLKIILEEQIKLAERFGTGVEETPGVAPPRQIEEFPLLTEEQINLIKVMEVDLRSPPRLLADRETIVRMIEQYGAHDLMPKTQEGREALFSAAPVEILDLLFRMQARDLYGGVRVLGNPAAMERFRDHVHKTWLIRSCATSRCHGGPDAGRFVLHNRQIGSEPTVYTNFLIMERYRLDDGTALLDYDDPEDSPLLQFALRPGDAARAHPEVRGYRPFFRSRADRRFQQAVAWLRSMYQPRPQYPIDYTPPTPSQAPEEDPPSPPR